MVMDYFYGAQAEKYSFIPIPKTLMTEKIFSGLQSWAKITYGFLMDRMQISMKNQWIDNHGLVYVVHPIEEIQNDMGISRKQAEEYLRELEQAGLLDRQIQGPGLPDRLYLKKINYEKY